MQMRPKRILSALTMAVLASSFVACSDHNDAPSVPSVAGAVTFDFVPTLVTVDNASLDYAKTIPKPARFVIVEAVYAGTTSVLASTVTDTNGNYKLDLPVNTEVQIQAKAQMPVVDGNPLAITVQDNTSTNAQWATISAAFNTGSSGARGQSLHAASGWTGTAYEDSKRAAAPFAILDAIYTGVQKVISVDPKAAFVPLKVYWSPKNIAAGDGEDPAQIAIGQINITHFVPPDPSANSGPLMYVLGKADNDTDEYDYHVVIHEFGHYLSSTFSRDDNIGGDHELGDLLDMRDAFSEGWGNGWSGIALNDPVYTDTSGVAQAEGDVINVSVTSLANAGFFSETSVQRIMWELSNAPTIGFAKVWANLTSAMSATPAVTSIHAFAYGLSAQFPTTTAELTSILGTESIALPSDFYGMGETNFGMPEAQDLNPIYLTHPGIGTELSDVCVNNTQAPVGADGRASNRVGEWRFIRMPGLPAGSRTFAVTATSATNPSSRPAMVLYDKSGDIAETDDKGVDTKSFSTALDGGDYVFAVTDLKLVEAAAARTCFTVRID